MSAEIHRWTWGALAGGLLVLALSESTAAEPAARLPRPRPPAPIVETAPPPAAVALWAEGLELRFRSAQGVEAESAEAKVLTVVETGDGTATETPARLPRPRPVEMPSELSMVAPDAVEAEGAEPSAPPRLPEPVDTACLARLSALGVGFTREGPIDAEGACHVDHPLKVASLGSGIAIEPEAILNCRTAEALALWARNVVAPAAEKHLGATPNKIVHGSTYVCRPRNNEPGAKLSEHAHANAVDISAIVFADREPFDIRFRGETGMEAAFQRAIRAGSCAYFTTVLGPGSDAAHALHFHFDMAERRSGYRLCELGEENTARAP